MSDTQKKLRVWWIPQVPMPAFHVEVGSVEEGVKIMDVLADYDLFQFNNRVKPDYCNTGGLQEFCESDKTDSPEGSWVDWWDEEYSTDNPQEYLEYKAISADEAEAEQYSK